jgi:ketosteroid isomerase-like protein
MSIPNHNLPMSQRNVELVRRGFEVASRGALEPVRELLAPDVRWYAAGHADAGCQNREQALGWMGEALRRGIGVDLIDTRVIDDDRVLVVLRRRPHPQDADPPPHAQILTFRDGKVIEMVVYPSPEDAAAETVA